MAQQIINVGTTVNDGTGDQPHEGGSKINQNFTEVYAELELAVRSDTSGITGADVITNMVSLTQAEYDAIVSPSATTLYVITDA
jgi:hypothetical protein